MSEVRAHFIPKYILTCYMFFDEGEVDEFGAGIQDQLEENRNTVKEKLMTIHKRLDALNLEDNLQQLKERTGHTIRVHRNIFA